ncbi:hypothetical protein C8R46DRAFT_43675 [Mycena filopes]|nr:hypothetical protein C8R46DRAFT_43675 [Mycena filopes]
MALPVELEREIFETAALSHRETIPTLLRVARRVHVWIEPLLYTAIGLCNSSKFEAIQRIMRTKPPTFLRNSVRHLFINNTGDMGSVGYDLLQLCPKIESFAILGSYSPTTLLPILQEISGVRRWCGDLEGMFGSAAAVDLGLPFFRNVTHMDLFNSCVDQHVWIMPALAALPALTHLGLTDSDVAFKFLRLVLEELPRLQVLAVTLEDNDPWEGIPFSAPVSDPRFVVVVNGDYWVNWEIGALGGIDFWAAADLFVARKRKGEIDASHVWLPAW